MAASQPATPPRTTQSTISSTALAATASGPTPLPAMATGPMAPLTAATIASDRWTRNGSSVLVTTTPGKL
jgi:hypothetical protein